VHARLSPRRPSAACVLAEMRRCGAPVPRDPRTASPSRPTPPTPRPTAPRSAAIPAAVVDALTARITALAAGERFEDAALSATA
jgi:DNA polymerase-3 subunit epsilon